MKKCRHLAISCIIFFAFIFSACGGTTDSSETVIDWWHIQIDDPGLGIWQELADQFEADHPGVRINITVLENEAFKSRLTTVMQSNDPPDLFQSWGGGVMQAYANAGLLKEITTDLDGAWGDSFSQTSLNVYGSDDGKYYGAPYDMGGVGFWYNIDLFEQAGITEPPATWTDFLDAVQKLKDADITPIALGGRDKWPGHFYWTYLAVRLGGKAAFDSAYDRTGSFTDETFVKAGEYLQQLIDLDPFQEGYLDATFGDETTAVATGNAAMDLMGQWASDNINRAAEENGKDINLGFFPFPAIEDGAGNPTDVVGGGGGFLIGRDAPPETVEFLKFLTTLDHQTEQAEVSMVLPTVKGAEAAVTDPNLLEVIELIDNAEYFQLYYDQYLPPAVGEVIKDATQGLYAGTMTPEQVAEAVEQSAATEITQ